jgi:hypothetical protein
VSRALDFVVIGGQKCGTTSLFEYLRRHPALYLPPGKEAPFFSHDVIWEAGWDNYARKTFAYAPPGALCGKVTPHYMCGTLYEAREGSVDEVERPEYLVPERIHEQFPDTKIIALVRDPVARAVSHYRMEVMRGLEERPFDVTVAELLQPEALERSRRWFSETTSYITNGEYGRILAPYVELFHDRVLVCSTRDLRSSPVAVVRRVFEFLGIDSAFVPDNLGVLYRQGGQRRRLAWTDPYRVQSAATANAVVRWIWHHLPQALRLRADSAFNSLAYRIDLWNRVTTGALTVDRVVETALRQHYAEDAVLLQRLPIAAVAA